jgi:hypothetical protein
LLFFALLLVFAEPPSTGALTFHLRRPTTSAARPRP